MVGQWDSSTVVHLNIIQRWSDYTHVDVKVAATNYDGVGELFDDVKPNVFGIHSDIKHEVNTSITKTRFPLSLRTLTSL